MPNELRDLWVDEVSLVDDGANHEAHVVLWKSKRLTDTPGDRVTMSLSAQQEVAMPELDVSGLPAEAQTFIQDMAKSHAALEKALAQAKTELTKSRGTAPRTDNSEILKKAPPEVRALIAKTNRRLAQAEKVAREERNHRLTQEAIAKAKTEFGALAVDHNELGAILKRLHDIDQGLSEKVEKVLKAATAQAEAGEIFKSVGSTAAKVTGAEGQIETLAKARAESKSVTYEQAFAEILDERPDLYESYLKEAN